MGVTEDKYRERTGRPGVVGSNPTVPTNEKLLRREFEGKLKNRFRVPEGGEIRTSRVMMAIPLILMLALVIAVVGGCGAKKPTLTSISPTSGVPGSDVKIEGKYFGKTQGSSSVEWDNMKTNVKSWSDTEVTATVPLGLKDGRYTVTITTRAGVSNEESFDVQSKVTQQTQDQTGQTAEEQVIQDYFEAINDQRYQDAYQKTSTAFKSVLNNYEQFVASYREYISSVTIRSIKKLPEFSNPGKGMFQVELEANYIKHYPAGSGNIPEFYVLVPDTNNPGQWLIDSAGTGP